MSVRPRMRQSYQLSVHTQVGGFSNVEQVSRCQKNKQGQKHPKLVRVITVNSENDDSAQTYKKVNNRSKIKVPIPKVSNNIKIFSTNAAGLLSKGESLVNEIHATSANIVTVQVTHCTSKGRIKMHTSFVK